MWGTPPDSRAGLAVAGRLQEVERGHVEAGLALRAAAGRPGATLLDDVLPDVLLLTAPALAVRLVEQRLGRVLALPAPERDLLLDTLEAWVAAAGSAGAAASALHCHRNTVLNRVRRLEALLGQELSGPAPVELALALRAHRLGAV
nr:helix-turn-helix domain-containing protein [Nocardioides perillae]